MFLFIVLYHLQSHLHNSSIIDFTWIKNFLTIISQLKEFFLFVSNLGCAANCKNYNLLGLVIKNSKKFGFVEKKNYKLNKNYQYWKLFCFLWFFPTQINWTLNDFFFHNFLPLVFLFYFSFIDLSFKLRNHYPHPPLMFEHWFYWYQIEFNLLSFSSFFFTK